MVGNTRVWLFAIPFGGCHLPRAQDVMLFRATAPIRAGEEVLDRRVLGLGLVSSSS